MEPKKNVRKRKVEDEPELSQTVEKKKKKTEPQKRTKSEKKLKSKAKTKTPKNEEKEEIEEKEREPEITKSKSVPKSDVKIVKTTPHVGQTSSSKKTTQATLDKFQIKIPEKVHPHYLKIPASGNISIYSWNVNGLRAVTNKGAIDNFIKKENPDIFCLNETKVDEDALSKEKFKTLHSDKYISYWNCCTTKSGYSGVAVFTKYQPDQVLYGISKESHDTEGRVITLEFPNFYLVSCYTPNAGENLKRLDYRVKEWDVEFQSYINALKKKKDVILCGDLNVAHKDIDIYEPKGHNKSAGFTPEERASFDGFLNEGYIDCFRHLHNDEVKFSYFSKRGKRLKEENKGWRLDYFIINDSGEKRLVECDILTDYDASDHCPIKLEWSI